jgi:hypothetical protein
VLGPVARPGAALGYLTPRQFLDEWFRRHPIPVAV